MPIYDASAIPAVPADLRQSVDVAPPVRHLPQRTPGHLATSFILKGSVVRDRLSTSAQRIGEKPSGRDGSPPERKRTHRRAKASGIGADPRSGEKPRQGPEDALMLPVCHFL
jgi:hypothetical protein